jgi:hypothetical protein
MALIDHPLWREAVRSLVIPSSADAGDVFTTGLMWIPLRPTFSVYGDRIVTRREVEADKEFLRSLGIDPEGL